MGIGAGDSVAFVDKNNLACVEVTYAASALGAANAIPNFRLAGDELAYILRDSNAKLLFVGAEFTDVIASIRDHLAR